MNSSTEQTINLPQLILIVLLSGLAIRYFFFSPATAQSRGAAGIGGIAGGAGGGFGAAAAAGTRAREADVERVQQMFPQVARRSVMWDLQRNGGNVAATTERILSGRGLEVPPQSFQPPLPNTASSNLSSSSSSSTPSKPTQPDLIQRYNLSSKLAAAEAETRAAATNAADATAETQSQTEKEKEGKQAWSGNKVERQALLQRRRDEMILAARRKMEERVKREGKGDGEGEGAGKGVEG